MKNRLTACVLVALCAMVFQARAQPLRRFNSSSYNVNDGLLQSHVWDMEFDDAGFMWLSYETGLQRFDGQHFVNIPVQNGLPANLYILFLKSKNGLLWICQSKGITAYSGLTGKFTQVFDYSLEPGPPRICPLGEDEGIVYFYLSTGLIIGIDENSLLLKSKCSFPVTVPASRMLTISGLAKKTVIHDHLLTWCDESGLFIWDLKKGAEARESHFKALINFSEYNLFLINENEGYYLANGRLNLCDFQKGACTPITLVSTGNKLYDISSFKRLNENQILVGIDNDLYLLDARSRHFSEHLVNFQNQPFSHFTFHAIRLDEFGNIYLLTRSEGFIKLLASTLPISYYGSGQRESNFVTCIEINKKDNHVLAGLLNGGLLIFDTSQNLLKHITQIGGMQSTRQLTISGIVHVQDHKYLLFPRLNSYCVLLNVDNGRMKKVPIIPGPGIRNIPNPADLSIEYYSSIFRLSNTKTLIAIDEKLYEVALSSPTEVKGFIMPYQIKGLCRFKNYLLVGMADSIHFLSMKNYRSVKALHVPDCGEIRCLAVHNDRIYAGSNRGLYVLDEAGNILSAFYKKTGLPDDFIYAIAVDSTGNIWCSTNKGIIRIGQDNSILQLSKEDGLQENEFNTNVIAQEQNEELFFGGVNGINSFYPGQIIKPNDAPKVVLTDIRVNDEDIYRDSAVWTMKKISLPYTSNNLYFEFTAHGTGNPEQYQYQYRITEVEKNWVRNGASQYARYVLPPGHFTFQLYAGKVYTASPANFMSLEIDISPPVWQTWWFRTLAGVLLALSLLVPIWQYNRRRYLKKIQDLQLQHELQHERERISRDLHDNLGAYAAAIAANVSAVQENAGDISAPTLNELQQNSQSIVNQLNDTIWALNRESIPLTAISDRFKVFLQKIQPSYPSINIQIKEHLTTDVLLSPIHALHLFRIMQEAVNNAVRHSHCESVLVSVEGSSEWQVHIIDDGIGMGGAASSMTGNGLRNMQQRAAEAGWVVKWLEEKPGGTRIQINPASTIN